VAARDRKDQLKSLCWGKRKMKSYLSLVGQKEAGREGRHTFETEDNSELLK